MVGVGREFEFMSMLLTAPDHTPDVLSPGIKSTLLICWRETMCHRIHVKIQFRIKTLFLQYLLMLLIRPPEHILSYMKYKK